MKTFFIAFILGMLAGSLVTAYLSAPEVYEELQLAKSRLLDQSTEEPDESTNAPEQPVVPEPAPELPTVDTATEDIPEVDQWPTDQPDRFEEAPDEEMGLNPTRAGGDVPGPPPSEERLPAPQPSTIAPEARPARSDGPPGSADAEQRAAPGSPTTGRPDRSESRGERPAPASSPSEPAPPSVSPGRGLNDASDSPDTAQDEEQNSSAEETASDDPSTNPMGTGDAALATTIRAQYKVDPNIDAAAIIIGVKDGKVSLTGSVADDEARNRIIDIASATKGVSEVSAERLQVEEAPANGALPDSSVSE